MLNKLKKNLFIIIILTSIFSCSATKKDLANIGLTKKSVKEINHNIKIAYNEVLKKGGLTKKNLSKFRADIGYEDILIRTARDRKYPNDEFGLLRAELQRIKQAKWFHKFKTGKNYKKAKFNDNRRIGFIEATLKNDQAQEALRKFSKLNSIETREISLSLLEKVKLIKKGSGLYSKNTTINQAVDSFVEKINTFNLNCLSQKYFAKCYKLN